MADTTQEVTQLDFSGGVDIVSDPIDLTETQVSDVRNMLLSGKQLTQRGGFVQYNSTAITTDVQVRSLYQFKNAKGTYNSLCQASATPASVGKIYAGSAGFPATGTLSSILTETAGALPAVFTDYEGLMVMTNGVDVPMMYEGTYGKIDTVYLSQNADVTFTDITSLVTDERAGTEATIVALDTLANGDKIYIGLTCPTPKGIRIEFGSSVNNNSADLTLHGWTGAADWTAITITTTDGTETHPATFAKSGDITFTGTTLSPRLINETHRYWLRLTVSAALDNVTIKQMYVMYDMQPLPQIWDGVNAVATGFHKTVDNGATYTSYTTEVSDGTASTVATLSSLDTVANGDWCVMKYSKKFVGAHFDMVLMNATAATMSLHYWNGAWTDLTFADGTLTATETLSADGYLWWAIPTDWLPSDSTGSGVLGYEIQISVSTAIDSSVTISEVEIIPQPDALTPYNLCAFHKGRLMLANTIDAESYVLIASEFNPYDTAGSDTDEIGLPTNEGITCIKSFYNELFIGTYSTTFLLEGYSPDTFGLLHVQSGGVGPLNHHGVVQSGKVLLFPHSSGFYAFDGTQTLLISSSIQPFFQDREATYFIPITRLEYIQGRYNSVEGCVDWAISKGTGQATNNFILTFYPTSAAWFFHDYAACSLATVTCADGQEAWYHGDYAGKLHNDYDNLYLDNGADVTAYITTRGYSGGTEKSLLNVFRTLQVRFLSQTSGTVTITAGVDGATLSAYGSGLSMVRTGSSYTWAIDHEPRYGNSIVFKLANATSGVPMEVTGIKVLVNPARRVMSI
jgi:hypothetical protein